MPALFRETIPHPWSWNMNVFSRVIILMLISAAGILSCVQSAFADEEVVKCNGNVQYMDRIINATGEDRNVHKAVNNFLEVACDEYCAQDADKKGCKKKCHSGATVRTMTCSTSPRSAIMKVRTEESCVYVCGDSDASLKFLPKELSYEPKKAEPKSKKNQKNKGQEEAKREKSLKWLPEDLQY